MRSVALRPGCQPNQVHVGERTKAKSNADTVLKNRFGANVKHFRHRLGFSQEELAVRADMHRTYLADIERGGRNISLFSIVRLVNALGTSLARFFRTLENDFDPPIESPARRRTATVRRRKTRASKPQRRAARRRR